MKLFSSIFNQIHDRKNHIMLSQLQVMPVEKIERMGLSLTLVRQGICVWPWRIDRQANALAKIGQMIVEEQRNVAELKAYTDAELRDLGISRSQIKHAVRNGRVGIDEAATVKAA